MALITCQKYFIARPELDRCRMYITYMYKIFSLKISILTCFFLEEVNERLLLSFLCDFFLDPECNFEVVIGVLILIFVFDGDNDDLDGLAAKLNLDA